jgi:DNA-binding Lrp family transcriptional regulator
MDEIDLALSFMLMANSRTSYRELADAFNMSVNSIHKRVKALVELDVIQGFKSRLGFPNFPGIINIVIFGISDVKQKRQLLNNLGQSEYIYNVTLGSGNVFYVHAYLQNIGELDDLVSFVRKIGNPTNLIVGIDKNIPLNSLKYLEFKPLTNLDYLIINSLKNNSRKSISDIALEVGASTKTIRRRLDRLTENFLVQFQIDWYPDKTGIIPAMIHLKFSPNLIIDDNEFEKELRNRYGSKILFVWAFSNLPNLKFVNILTQSMKELQDLITSLLSENYEKLDLTVLIEGKMFPTWIDTFLEEKVSEINLR